jgi:hypothetical protein
MPESSTTIFRSSTSSPPVDPAWEEAALRVESYLRAHHLESRALLSHLATEIIDEARGQASRHPRETPVTLAMQVTHHRIETWIAQVAAASDWVSHGDRAHGRLALVIANLPGRWSNHFLSMEPVPPELTAAMASFHFQSGPELRFSNMPPAPLEFGFDESDHPSAEQRSGWFLLRAASGWLMLVGLIGVAWSASH